MDSALQTACDEFEKLSGLDVVGFVVTAPASGIAGYDDIKADKHYYEAVQRAVDNMVSGVGGTV